MKDALPPIQHFLGKRIPSFNDHVIKQYINSGANGHVFRATHERTQSDLAFKIVPRQNLVVDPPERYLDEASRANQLENSAVVRHHLVIPYTDEDTHIDCMVFVCDFVDGKSLKDYIAKKTLHDAIDIPFITDFLSTILGLLYEMDARGIAHGDLHAGNILVQEQRFALPAGGRAFRVTDFGLRRLSVLGSDENDYLSVASILNELLSLITYARLSSPADRFAFNVIRDEIQRHLLEHDVTRDPIARAADRIFEKMTRIDERFRQARDQHEGSPPGLDSPFDYPNCEQIGKSHVILQALYSSRLLGLEEIRSRSNLVLTGPRGCGKTTVFRALSLDYLGSTGRDDPTMVQHIGIYYGCDDLYFAFPRYNLPERDDLLDVPVHFVVVTLLSRLLEQLEEWSLKHFALEWRKRVQYAVSRLWNVLGWTPPDGSDSTDLSTLLRRMRDRERPRAANKHKFGKYGVSESTRVGTYLTPDVMVLACEIIREEFPFIAARPIYFFIDDYSKPKITEDMQLNLNRLFMLRTADMFFKLSTESPVSFVRRDIDKKGYVEGREFEFVNLGLRYITDASSKTLPFLEDVFERRFSLVDGYPVDSLDRLLGSFPRNENAMARAFRGEADGEETSLYGNYAGKETIAAMCSGDIHYIIRLVAQMVEEFGGREALDGSGLRPVIPVKDQAKAIRAAAGSFMESIRTLPDVGDQMADVVGVFGQVARSYLMHRRAKNREGQPPHQASRIEPYESLRLSTNARRILEELLRYSIFIQDPRGKSRRGRVVPRFYLRRYLIPHFNLTFSKRDSIELERSQLEQLLLFPERFEAKERLREDTGVPDSSGGRSNELKL